MNENETNIISKMSIKVIGGGVYLKNKPQTITITWEIKDENGNIITPDTLSVNNIPLDPTTTSKTYHRVFSDVDFTVRAVKDGVLAIGTTTARFVGPTQTVEDSLTSNSRSIAASANSVRLLNEKIENNNSFKGLFTSLDDLKKKFRSGNNGDWAIVGEGIPAPIYIWNKNGWEATGGQYTGSTIDLDSYYTKEGVADYTDDYNVSKNHSHIVKIYDLVNWKVVERKPDAPVFQLGQSYDAGEVVNMTDDNDSSYECLQSTITAPYLNQEVRSFTLAEAISFLPEDLRVTGQKISFLSSELNAWMTYVFTGGDYTNPTYWEIFTNNIDPDTNQKIADLQAKDEDLQNQINEDVTNLNNHIAESDAKFEEIDNTLTKHEDRMDDIEDEILLSSVEAACAPKDVEILADRAYKDHLGNIIADEYITRDTLTEEIIDITNQQVTDLKPGSVQPEDLSEAVKQMIGCKKITNLPDEEDITVTEDNTLKFKDREYSPKDYSGMGKKILRKHYIDGINTLTQHMINKPNTIYVVRYDYCLQGQTIEIPENCVLEFDGGSLRNGTVKFNKTIIRNTPILNVTVEGSYIQEQLQPDNEDISVYKNENNYDVLKFKDRKYDESIFSGKGYKILRKNIINGINVLTQEMVNEENTIYEIRYDFDLNFDWENYESAHNYAVKIPKGCILKFNGGSIYNGLLNFSEDTYIEGNERGDCMKYGSYDYIDKPKYHIKNDPVIINRLSEIFCSYYKQNEKFHYGHENTMYNPNFDISKNWTMNCSTLTSALILGIPFENSKYNGKDNETNGYGWYDKDFYDWLLDGADSVHFSKYSHRLARYLNDRGFALSKSENKVENLQPGDILFYNLENKDPWNNPFYYEGIDHSATFAYRVNDTRFAVWEVWGESQVFGLGFYDNDYFDEHIRLVARVPRAYGDNFQKGNIAYSPYTSLEKHIEANTSFPNTVIKTISLSKPISAYKYYTVIAKIKFLSEGSHAYPIVRYSVRGNFGYRSFMERPKDDVYYIPFCLTNAEIDTKNPPSPLDKILTITSVNLEVYWWPGEVMEEDVVLEKCFLVEGIIPPYNPRFKEPAVYPVNLSTSSWNPILKNVGSKWVRLPGGFLISGRFELDEEGEEAIKSDTIEMCTIELKNGLNMQTTVQGHTMNNLRKPGVLFLDYMTTGATPSLKVMNTNGGKLHYFDVFIPLNSLDDGNFD